MAGTDARGVRAMSAPNLVDADWLYGGDEAALMKSILDGRTGQMPAHSQSIDPAGITNLAHYVASLSGRAPNAVKAALGKSLYGACAACHGTNGKGNPALGAPDLTDSVWLYGGSMLDIEQSIRDGRSGVMPAWRDRLGEDRARLIAAWLHGAGSHAPSRR